MKKEQKIAFISVLAAVLAVFVAMGLLVSAANGAFEKKNAVQQEDAAKVYFYGNYPGAGRTSVRVKVGDKVSRPEDPEYAGYTFDNWYTSLEGDELFDFESGIEENTSVFAHWLRSEYRITLSKGNGEPDEVCLVEMGGKLARPEPPVRENYTFVDWYTDSAHTQVYNFDSEVDGDFTLYAGWKLTRATVTFDYNYNGAQDPVSQTVEGGETMTPPTPPTREDFRFLGWSTSRGATYDLFNFETTPIEEDFTLYARWERTHWIVTFAANYAGADPESVPVHVGVGSAAQLPEDAITRYGYELEGWYNEAACTSKADLTNVSASFTVYANWVKAKFTVEFNLNYPNAEGAPASQQVEYQASATQVDTPEREGFTFVGWYTDSEYAPGSEFTFDMPIEGNTTLYARWQEEQEGPSESTVTLMYHNGTDWVEYQEFTFDKTPFYPNDKISGSIINAGPTIPALEGYYFRGWYTDETFASTFNFSAAYVEAQTVYARMLKPYEFQAELVNLAGKQGFGGSVNYFEHGMIAYSNLIHGGDVHNDFYITGMYASGLYIDFEINATSAVSELVLSMRVSSEMKDFSIFLGTDQYPNSDTFEDGGREWWVLANEQYQIFVGGSEQTLTQILHDGIVMPAANLNSPEDLSDDKTPFEDCVVYIHLSLQAGKNIIRFRTNNQAFFGNGTFNAMAPMIDSITIYSDVALTMTEYPQFLAARKAEIGLPAAIAALPPVRRKEW